MTVSNKRIDHRLASLKSRMSDAFDAGEWQVLADLDVECQSTVSAIIQEDPRAMFDELREMLAFYADLIERCKIQRNDFAGEVKQLRQSKKQNDIYSSLRRMSAVQF